MQNEPIKANPFQSKAVEGMAEEPEEVGQESASPYQEEIADEEEGAQHYEEMAQEHPEHAEMFQEMAEDEKRHIGMLEACEGKSGEEAPEEKSNPFEK
jgi:rubrerythrin